MIVEKRVAEILRSLRTTDARELAKAFAFEPKRSYDLACAAVEKAGDLAKAADLVESGWSHEDVVIPFVIHRTRQVTLAPAGTQLCGYVSEPALAQGQDADAPAARTEE